MKDVVHERMFYYKILGRLNQVVNRIECKLQRKYLFSSPVDIDLVLTRACNFSCVFCRNYETPFGSKSISLHNLNAIAKQMFPYAMRLSICSGGEPYLHTQLEDILRIARQYGLNTWLLSNGSMMERSRIRKIVREELVTEHGFSIDGYKAETLAAIRVNSNLEKILENINMLQEIKKEEGKNVPKIIIRYALMRSNIEELPLAIHRWGKMGIDTIHCSYVSLTNNIDSKESLFFHQEITKDIFLLSRDTMLKYPNMRLILPPLVSEEKEKNTPRPCGSPWSFVMIDSNGEIMPCYRSFEAMRFGNLFGDEKFIKIWNSTVYQKLRGTVNDESSEKYFPYCNRCENRFGWGSEGPHMGDKFWLETIGKDLLPFAVNHSRSKKR